MLIPLHLLSCSESVGLSKFSTQLSVEAHKLHWRGWTQITMVAPMCFPGVTISGCASRSYFRFCFLGGGEVSHPFRWSVYTWLKLGWKLLSVPGITDSNQTTKLPGWHSVHKGEWEFGFRKTHCAVLWVLVLSLLFGINLWCSGFVSEVFSGL